MGDDHLSARPPVELYELASDPWEQKNLAGLDAHGAVERRMAAMLDQVLTGTRDPVVHGPIPRPPDEAAIFERIWDADAVRRRNEQEAQLHAQYRRLVGQS
jgi:hypothetical protein